MGVDPDDELAAAWAGLGGERASRLTPAQQRTMVAMRALASSPLFFGGDPLQCDAGTLALITDAEMLRCNQEGGTGRLRYAADGIEVWVSRHRTDDRIGWFGVFNRTENPVRTDIPTAVLSSGGRPMGLHTVWDGGRLPPLGDRFEIELEPDDVMFVRYDVPTAEARSSSTR